MNVNTEGLPLVTLKNRDQIRLCQKISKIAWTILEQDWLDETKINLYRNDGREESGEGRNDSLSPPFHLSDMMEAVL